jgi:Mitochondrial biogenesis AIM24
MRFVKIGLVVPVRAELSATDLHGKGRAAFGSLSSTSTARRGSLGSGSYWASEGSVEVSATRERAWASFRASEGVIDWQTKVSGHGRVALKSQGRVEEVALSQASASSRMVNPSLPPRATKSLVKTYISGEAYCWTYDGPGWLLVTRAPYWQFVCWGRNRRPVRLRPPSARAPRSSSQGGTPAAKPV